MSRGAKMTRAKWEAEAIRRYGRLSDPNAYDRWQERRTRPVGQPRRLVFEWKGK